LVLGIFTEIHKGLSSVPLLEIEVHPLKDIEKAVIHLLVFYIGNILVDKNTLCKCCFLTGILVQFRVFK
jgi:hypothetical protein